MKFNKNNFTSNGGYIKYNGRFVVRIKHEEPTRFINFLINNFTVEEYFNRLGVELPLQILESKGYLS